MQSTFAFLEEEFWWLNLLERPFNGWVGVATSWWTRPPENPGWQEIPGRIPLENLAGWADQHSWANVHRTLAVYEAETGPMEL